MPESVPPPSAQIPGRSGGSAPYILGVVVLVALMGGLLCWKKGGASDAPAPVTTQAATQTSEPINLNPPPPPPPKEEDDAGADAGPATAQTSKSGGVAGPSPCTKCGSGEVSGALSSALRVAQGSVSGCYQRALRTSEVSGSMTVSVQVGANGAVCGASITNDSVHSSDVSACVLGKFNGRSFPPPTSGCVVVNLPIAFKIKQ